MAHSKASDSPPVQQVIHHEEPSGIENLLEQHGKKLLVFVLLAVIAICASFVMRALKKEKLVEAAQAFTGAATIADFEKVVEEYGGTPAAGNALLMLSDRHQTYGKFEDARVALLQFTKDFKKHPRYYQGLFNLGIISEQLGKPDEAKKYFGEVIASSSELAPLALLRDAEETLAAGDLEAAKAEMESIPSKFPGSPFIDRIDARVKSVEQMIILAANPPPAPEPEPEPAPVEANPLETPTPGAPNTPPALTENPANPDASASPEPADTVPAPDSVEPTDSATTPDAGATPEPAEDGTEESAIAPE